MRLRGSGAITVNPAELADGTHMSHQHRAWCRCAPRADRLFMISLVGLLTESMMPAKSFSSGAMIAQLVDCWSLPGATKSLQPPMTGTLNLKRLNGSGRHDEFYSVLFLLRRVKMFSVKKAQYYEYETCSSLNERVVKTLTAFSRVQVSVTWYFCRFVEDFTYKAHDHLL